MDSENNEELGIEVLSENRSDNANDDRLTAPMQGSPKKRSVNTNADWLRATARN